MALYFRQNHRSVDPDRDIGLSCSFNRNNCIVSVIFTDKLLQLAVLTNQRRVNSSPRLSRYGGIGRHNGLKIRGYLSYGFESRYRYQLYILGDGSHGLVN